MEVEVEKREKGAIAKVISLVYLNRPQVHCRLNWLGRQRGGVGRGEAQVGNAELAFCSTRVSLDSESGRLVKGRKGWEI